MAHFLKNISNSFLHTINPKHFDKNGKKPEVLNKEEEISPEKSVNTTDKNTETDKSVFITGNENDTETIVFAATVDNTQPDDDDIEVFYPDNDPRNSNNQDIEVFGEDK